MGHKRKPFYTPDPSGWQYVLDRRRAAAALGRPVKRPNVVHHHTLTQLVICEDQAYHWLLHRRTVAVKFGYDPNVHHACYCCQKPYPVDRERLGRKFCPACTYDYTQDRSSPADPNCPEPTWGGKTASELGEITVFEQNMAALKARAGRIW